MRFFAGNSICEYFAGKGIIVMGVNQESLKTRTTLLIAGTVGLLFAGIIYAWSILKVPLGNEFGWSNSDLATAYTITISLFCLGCIAGGFLMRAFGPKIPILLGGILVCLGFFLTSTLDGSSLGLLFLYYGVMGGLGIGMAYNSLLAAIGAWYPDKKGFASGVMMMGFGASTLIFGNLAGSLIANASFGWRKVFVLLAICTGVALIANGILIRMPGPDAGLPKPPAPVKKDDENDFVAEDMPTSKMITRPSFWMFFVAMMLLGAAGSSLISFAKDFAVSVGVVKAAGLFVGILSIANGLGRILAGSLYDKFGRKFIMVYVAVIEIAACVVCMLAAMTNSAVLCLIGFLLVGLSYGGNTCAVSVLITSFYGNKYYAQNLSFGLLTLLPSSFLAKLSTTVLNATGGYIVPFALLAGYGVVSFILNINNKRP